MNHKELAVKIAEAFTPQKDWKPYPTTFDLFEDKEHCTRFLNEWKILNKKYKQRFYTDKASRSMALILIERALDTTESTEE